MTLPHIIGIDPGLGGAVAFVFPEPEHTYVVDTPTRAKAVRGREYRLGDMLALLRREVGGVGLRMRPACAIEKTTRPAKLTRGAGIWEGMLTALGVPFELVAPQRWKRALGLPRGATKGQSIVLAQQLFPELADQLQRKRDDGRAEALLIAEWRRRQG